MMELLRDLMQYFDCLTRDLGADAVSGQNKNVQIHLCGIRFQPALFFWTSVGSRLLSLRLFNQSGDLFIQHALLAISQSGEAMIKAIQLFAGQRKSKILAALVERVPPAVLAQH